MTGIDLNTISKCTLFKNINKQDINNLFKLSIYNEKEYYKNEIISFQGDQYNNLIIILSGEINTEMHSPDGKKITISTLKRSEAVATGILFASDNIMPVTVVAKTDIRILIISKKTVITFCQKNENFLLNYLQDTGNKIIFLGEKIKLLNFLSITQKIAAYLISLSEKQGTERLTLPYSKEQLADLFGVARPSLSRVLSQLYDQGILESKGKIIHILDKDKLIDLIDS